MFQKKVVSTQQFIPNKVVSKKVISNQNFVPKKVDSKYCEKEKHYPKALMPKAKAFINNQRSFVEINLCDKKTKVFKRVKCEWYFDYEIILDW